MNHAHTQATTPEDTILLLSPSASSEWDGDYGTLRQSLRRRDMRIAAGITSRRTGRPCAIVDAEGNILDVVDPNPLTKLNLHPVEEVNP